MRLIPAHAGKTCNACGSEVTGQAHPRSRGENTFKNRVTSHRLGSSPLTRGKRSNRSLRRDKQRLIPAHAGKTSRSIPAPGIARAHPRSRGENGTPEPATATDAGSSPLTRGKRRVPDWFPGQVRLIPAHAGKTRPLMTAIEARAAHPRSRGENTSTSNAWTSVNGSSPLTRGKPDNHGHQGRERGLIPAHAGKTVSRRAS